MKNNNKYHKIISSVLITSVLFGGGIAGGYFLSNTNQNNTFRQNTTISGVDVSGLTRLQAQDKINQTLDATAQDIMLDIVYKDKVWSFNGSNFQVNTNVDKIVENVYNKKRSGDHYQNVKLVKDIQNMGFDSSVALNYVFSGMEEKIDSIASEIEQQPQDATITFYPNSTTMFNIQPHIVGITVDKVKLYDDISTALSLSTKATVQVPVIETMPNVTTDQLNLATVKQGEYSTDYSKSSQERKSNIQLAFSKINGTMVGVGEQFSFNQVVGERTQANGFKTAKVILDGKYQDGIGGGVCQASTTLYNALINAGLQIDEVHKHTLPASYVPLAFDAMVSYGYADLKFTNNTNAPIFLKTYTDNNKVYAEVYGNTKAPNQTIKTKAEFIGVLPHSGDMIVDDTEGLYADKIMFKGEYFRVKYPQEGYESKAYTQLYQDGKLVNETLIRHERYEPQQGIVYQGVETLPEGMTLPNNSVNIIPPQQKVDNNTSSIKQNIDKANPANYNL